MARGLPRPALPLLPPASWQLWGAGPAWAAGWSWASGCLLFSSSSAPASVSTAGTPSALPASTQEVLRKAGLRKLLVANRGEIACRVMATARKLGLRTVAVYSEADRAAKHVQFADEAYCIGGAAARDSYLRADALLDVARRTGSHAVHPGYGFLSENAAFSEACAKEGLRFVGPPGSAIRSMGDKAASKAIMSAAGVPVIPGYHGEDQSSNVLLAQAESVGFPLLVKAVAGGGGKGMKLAHSMQELPEAIASARREAGASFGNDRVLLERYITRPRHVEVQVVADSHGQAVYVFDRDCSLQRRHQKIIEEAPAPGLPPELHRQLGEAAVKAALAVGYTNAGTVEFILDVDAAPSSSSSSASSQQQPFFFLEMNTRLQVEHPVSEAVAGVDLVEWQLAVAAGAPLPLTQEQLLARGPRGHALEARLYAESPRNNFLPGAGTVRRWRPPAGAVEFAPPAWDAPTQASATASSAAAAAPSLAIPVRVDSGVREGDEVGINYDPMIAKLIVWGEDRGAALRALTSALAETQVAGLPTNVPYLQRLAAHPAFAAMDLDTAFVVRHAGDLMAPQPLPAKIAAVAAVARRLLQTAAESSAMASASAPAGTPKPGPWQLQDSKRLWHKAVQQYRDMAFPEGAVPSAVTTAAAGGGHGGKGVHGSGHGSGHGTSHGQQGLSVALTVGGEGEFEAAVAGCDSAGASSGSTGPCKLAVRGARLVAPDRVEMEVDGERLVADVAQYPVSGGRERALVLWTGGCAHEFRWPVPAWSKDVQQQHGGYRPGGSGEAVAPGSVLAPMPGRVVKVLAKEGDKVAAGAVLVVLEAMKMEHAVTAPRAGVVKKVATQVAQQVQDGQVLAVVE